MIELREYQNEIVNKIRNEFAMGNHRIIMQLATGGGKTVIFTFIAKSTTEKGGTVLVITDRKELLQQAGSTFDKFGLKAEYLRAKTKIIPEKSIVVAMSETIKRRLKKSDYIDFLQKFTLIIIDEAHKASFDKLFESITPFQYIIGATATPYRRGGAGKTPLSKYYDSIVNGIEINKLIKLGYLSNIKAYGVPIDFSKVKLKGGDFDSNEVAKVLEKNEVFKGVVENYKRIAPNSKALLFAPTVEASKKICSVLLNEGISAKHIDANSKDRNEILQAFEKGDFNILCNVGILTTGYDCPSIETIILYRATMSLPLYLQMVGRGSRIYKGKDHFKLLDFGGNVLRHNNWQDDRMWSLDFATKPKKQGEAPLKNCPQCGAFIASSSRECSFCGYIYPIKEKKKTNLKIDLVLLSPTQIQSYARNKASFEELVEIQKEKGYHKYWIARNCKTYEDLTRFAMMISPKNYKGWLYYNKSKYGF